MKVSNRQIDLTIDLYCSLHLFVYSFLYSLQNISLFREQLKEKEVRQRVRIALSKAMLLSNILAYSKGLAVNNLVYALT